MINFFLTYIKNRINNLLYLDDYIQKNNINFHIETRIKSKKKILYKIFDKKRIPIDIFGIRIIYNNLNNIYDTNTAYIIENILRRNFFEIPFFYDNYIANPKNNLYQSIHFYFYFLLLFEIQIRNNDMHITCINGTASNYY